MLNILKGELIKKGLDPIKSVMDAIGCSENTARNKLKGSTAFTVQEALKIERKYFSQEKYSTGWLFQTSA